MALAAGPGVLCGYPVRRGLHNPASPFPTGTLTVNLSGCFAIGLLAAIFLRSPNDELRLALITGFLGGFTTFSAFAFETLTLLRNGALLTAVIYTLASSAGGVAAAYLGWRTAHNWSN